MLFFCSFIIFIYINWEIYFFSFRMFEILGFNLSLSFIFDFYSFFFCIIVSLITMVVIIYSLFYIGFIFSNRFIYLVLLFSLSIMILIFRGNFFLIILGWDGLGVVSFALVIFYQNEIRVIRGLLTIFINRFGDGAIIFFICIFFPFNTTIFIIVDEYFLNSFLGVFLFFLACFSKSAQFPFMSWLPAAITAPTPVSSLVHSSTLVTAGVYLIIRFNLFLHNYLYFSILFSVGLFTIGVGGFLAILETDFKKVVAFSTLRQLGFLMFILSFGEVRICFFHLLTHAIFKSFLFIMCGIFIAYRYGGQDARLIGIKFFGRVIFQVIIIFSCLSLRGFPLTLGFLSRDLILETFIQGEISFSFLFFFLIFCSFTVCYSLKLFYLIVFSIKLGNPVIKREFLNDRKIFLFFLLFFLFRGGLIIEEFLIDDEIFSLSLDYKLIDLIIFSLGVLIFKIINYFYSLGFIVSDYFWVSRFLNLLRKNFYKFGLIFRFNVSFYFNYFFVFFFKSLLLRDFKLIFYLKDIKNFWYLTFLVFLFSLLY